MGPFHRNAYRKVFSMFRSIRNDPKKIPKKPDTMLHEFSQKKIRVAFIHNEKKIGTGAHQINDLIARALRARNIAVRNFYPKNKLIDAPVRLKGIANILFFYSLLVHKDEVLKYDLVQGTTYTPLPFLAFNIPVVTHFGSTTKGFLSATPLAKDIRDDTRREWYRLRREGVIDSLNVQTRQPMRDIGDIEMYVASQSHAVIATSELVKSELIAEGVDENRIFIVHNAIEDYWFEARTVAVRPPGIVFLGRLGADPFTLKLKGLDRLVHLYDSFPSVPKTTIAMTTNKRLTPWLRNSFRNHETFINLRKDFLPNVLASRRGSVLFLSSRYEGFSLSLIEAMSQGLIPVAYSVGVVPEIIRDGENGYIVSSQKEAIAKVRLILGNPDLREEMAKNAEETAKIFRSENIAPKLEEIYRTVLASDR